MSAVRVCPITDADLPRVAEFLHTTMNHDVPVAAWTHPFDNTWDPDRPNNGFMLLDGDGDGDVAGAYLAFYSTRELRGRVERFCNLGAWCVRPDRRLHGLKLLKALLNQDGYHFLDLSPSGNVVPINQRLGFTHLDTSTAVVPALPWAWGGPLGSVTADPATLRARLSGRDLQRYRDHSAAAAARHLLLSRGGRSCYVVFRMDRRKRLPRVFASVLHVGDPALFHDMLRPLGGYLLARHGALALLAELRVVGRRPAGSVMLAHPRPKMYRSASLGPDDVDYFYSELVSVTW